VTVRKTWQRQITELLDAALDQNGDVIDEVAAAITTAILDGHHIYAFGAGHSTSLVNEMFRRAGGFKIVRPLWNTEMLSREDEERAGQLENEFGYYHHLTDGLDWGPGDLVWVLSNSGRNALVIELAQEAKRHGVKVIALTSLTHSAAVSATPGLPKLPEIADYIYDNLGVLGDASIAVPGLPEWVAPTSTIIGAALIQATWAEVAERLVARGYIPEIWGSANRGQIPAAENAKAGPRPAPGE
jgi:uncharacterized phosphosugar-binding protein